MQSQKRGRGCLFYACITIIVVIIALFIGTYLGTRQALKMVIANYTDSAPMEVPSLNLPEAERTQRLAAVERNVESALQSGGTITLDAVDLNLLLGRSPDLRSFAEQIHLTIETNQIKAQVSLPLDQFAEWQKVATRFRSEQLRGRYLNAILSLEPTFQNGNLQLDLRDIQVKGNSLPETFTGKVQLEKLTEQANRDPELRTVLNRISGIAVTNKQVQIDLQPGIRPAPQPL